jgi:predicted DNA-binding protein (MmcQ/YjbR family)
MPQRGGDLRGRLVDAALAYPDAYEDFPWGEQVAKVNKKIFAFLGREDAESAGVALKLPESHEFALTFANVTPTGYGLGRAGWVSVDCDHQDGPDVEVLLDWLDESYRAVAPKRLIAILEAFAPEVTRNRTSQRSRAITGGLYQPPTR